MKHTHHHFLITLGALVTVLVVALYFYMSNAITNMTDAVVSAKGEAVNLQIGNTMDAKLKKLYSGSEGDWEKLYSAFVPADNVVPFIAALEAIGPRVGGAVSVASIDSTAPEAGSLAVNGYVNAKVTASGSWASVIKIIELIENMPYKVTISNVRLDQSNSVVVADKPGGASKQIVGWVASFDVSAVKSI